MRNIIFLLLQLKSSVFAKFYSTTRYILLATMKHVWEFQL